MENIEADRIGEDDWLEAELRRISRATIKMAFLANGKGGKTLTIEKPHGL